MDGLEKIRKGLYAREPDSPQKRSAERDMFHADAPESRSTWEQEPVIPDAPTTLMPKAVMSFAKKLFIGSAVFFVVAVSFASLVILRGGNVVSAEKVSVQFAGPVSTAGGEPFSFEVSVRNDNNSPIEAADLLLEYPEGTRRADNPLAALPRFREALGAIAPGVNILKKEEAVLFGEEGISVSITATLEYRVKGSNALIKKTAQYAVTLGTSALSLSVDSAHESANNAELTLTVEVKSNSATPLHDIVMEADYPFGFAFERAAPAPTTGERAWALGDLAPGATRRISLTGVLTGAEGDERVIRFRAGPAQSGTNGVLGTALVSASHSVIVRKPFLALSLVLDNEENAEFVTEKGKTVRVSVAWENNLPTPATDAQIIVHLNGALFDPASVVTENGYWRAQDGTVVWDASADSALATLEPGARGQEHFSVNVRSASNGVYALKNPSFSIQATISARGPAGAGESGGAVTTSVKTEVKLLADLGLGARLARAGAFANRGPIPPRVGAETTYTVVWSLSNAFNEISGAKVSATLPSYVRFLNIVSPASEQVSYDAVSGAVVWDAGDVKAGVGIGGAPREAAFQVALVPADNQAGTVPTVIGEAVAGGDDRFTGRAVTSAPRPPLTTHFSDASFVGGQEVVQK